MNNEPQGFRPSPASAPDTLFPGVAGEYDDLASIGYEAANPSLDPAFWDEALRVLAPSRL